jgi:hypothetical protein
MIEPKHQSLFALAGLKVAYAVAVVAALGAGVGWLFANVAPALTGAARSIGALP